MRNNDIRRAVLPFIAVAATVSAYGQSYHSVDFSAQANGRFDSSLTINGNTFPTGALLLGGVPFDIPSVGNNVWFAYEASGPNPRQMAVPTSVQGVTDVWTLMGTYWGEGGAGTLASIEFFGSDTGYVKFDLDGGSELRDYNDNPLFPGTVSGTSTIEVFNNGLGQRLDRQHFLLPVDFFDEQLARIVVSDNGEDGVQRVFVGGITLASSSRTSVPDGGHLTVLMAAMVGLCMRFAPRRC